MSTSQKKNVDCTVVVPAFNRANLVHFTIDSILHQYLPFAEVIVVNDGSTDDTAEVVASYGTEVRQIITSNRGVQHARNVGAEHASSEWVAFCDSDDLLLPHYTLSMSRFFDQHPSFDLAFSKFTLFLDSAGTHAIQAPCPRFGDNYCQEVDYSFTDLTNDPFGGMLKRQSLWPTGMCIRRKAFFDIGGYDLRFRNVGSEDLEFTVRAVLALRSAISDDNLVLVRRHPGNDSAHFIRQHIGEAIVLEHLLHSQPALQCYRWRIRQSIVHRLTAALGGTWAQGDFATFKEICSWLQPQDHNFKTIVQRMIVSSPPAIRDKIWRAIRDRHKGELSCE